MHQNREWRRKALPKAPKNGAGGSLDLSPPTPNPSICIPAASASMLRPRPALMTADVIHPSPEPREEPQGSRYSALLQGKGFNIHFLALHKPERGVSPRLQRARRDCQPRALAKVRKEPGSAEGKAPSFQNRKRRRVGGCSLFVLPGAFLLRPQTPETFSSQEAAAPRPCARLHEERGLRGTRPNGGDAPK